MYKKKNCGLEICKKKNIYYTSEKNLKRQGIDASTHLPTVHFMYYVIW